MTIGIVGKKLGMTRVFTEEGRSIPVTAIEATPNRVTGLLESQRDGYRAVQVAYGDKRRKLIKKPQAGTLAKAQVDTAEGLREFRLEEGKGSELALGAALKVDIFSTGQKVDVTGVTIGKGFAGVIKRHNFSSQRNSHGNSRAHRAPGSIGQNQTPGRVFPGKKMAGRMGGVKQTVQNLEIIRVDTDRNLMLVKGAVPGARGGRVIVRPAVKAGKPA